MLLDKIIIQDQRKHMYNLRTSILFKKHKLITAMALVGDGLRGKHSFKRSIV